MPFISVTRLRIRSIRFLPAFFLHTFRTMRQVRKAQGFIEGSVLNDRRRTFWTLTSWDSEAAMRAFMTSGDHRAAMPHLLNWCDEASVVHWEKDTPGLPPWVVAAARMRSDGRPSKVHHPSGDHLGMQFPAPRTQTAVPIRPLRE